MSLLQKTELFEALEPIFKKINNENWDQEIGTINLNYVNSDNSIQSGHKCCVGTHIAMVLGNYDIDVNDGECYFHYMDGRNYVLRLIKRIYPQITYYKMCAIFHCAGSPMDPFGTEPWPCRPSEVLKNMKFIETMPPDASIHFNEKWDDYRIYYNNESLKAWLKLERSRIISKFTQLNLWN